MSKEYAERKAKEKQRQSAKKSTSATKPASTKKSAGVGGAIAKGIRTVSKQVQSTQQKAYDQILGEDVVNVVEGAARKSALDSYISAYGNLGGYDPNGAMTFGQAQSYLAALENARAATKGGVSARAFLPKTPKELNDFLGNYKALGGEADRIRAEIAKGEKAYNAEYYYPRKYNGSDAAKINQAMAKLRFDGDAGKDELAWLKENQYNYWTSDQIKKGIADTQRQIEEQKKRKRNNLILEDQLKRMQDAAYTVATRDWSAQDLKDMARYASIYEKRDNADLAEAFAQSGASAQARSYEKELGSLYKKFKGMGYSDEEISALRTYFLQNQHAMERARDLRELSEFSKDHKVLASIASVPMNMMSGIGYADLARQKLTAGTDPITGAKKRVDQYAPLTAMSDASTTMRGAVSEDMSGLGRFLYNTGMSIVDSRMAMGSGAWLGEALLGGAAAMQATRNAYQRGATDAQALAVGAWAGASESLFEHISLDRLRIMQTSSAAARRTAKQFLIDLAKQAGVEGSEEAFTTLSNTLGDAIIMRDKSELNSAIRAYMANGEGREAATRKAWSDWFGQLALDFAGGALSGGVNGAASMGIGTMQRNAQNAAVGQRVNENGYADDLIEQAASLPDGGEALALAQRLQGMQPGRKANRTAGELYSAVQSGELQQRVQGRLEELGLTENAAETAGAIVRSLNGQQLSGKQSRLLDGRQAQRVIFEYEHAQRGMKDPAAWTQENSARSGERAKTMLSTNGGRVKQFAAQFGDQAKAVERVYRKGQDAEDFATSFEAAYEIGRGGGKLDAAQKHNATRALEPEQVEIAWALGREAAKSGVSDGRIATPSVTARNDMNGGKTNGTEVHLRRGGERADGARTLGQVRSLEPKAKRAEKGKNAESRPADSQALEVTVGEKISALRLGVENGAVAQTAYTVIGNETESMKKARALGEERGMKVVFFAGGNLGVHTRTDKTGYVASARGLVQGDTVYVRADHEQFTAEQLMQHELGHEAIKNGEIDLAEVRERIRTEFGEEQFDAIVQLYLDAYAETGMTADEIWEEIVCDSLGDMNIFSDSFEALERKPAELLHAAQRAANESRGEKREQEGRAPPEGQRLVSARFSQETKPDKGTKAATRKEAVSISATDPANLARYQAEITSVLDGTMSSGRMVLIGRPSAVLSKYLHSEHPLYMPQSAIKKAALTAEEGGKHGLGRAVFDELPFQFDDPLAITGNTTRHEQFNDNSIVVWTDWMTENGDSVIVPIRIDVNGKVGLYNNVNTVFDAYDSDYVADLLRDGNVLYTKNNRSIQELLSTRREVPKVQQMNASVNSISDSNGKSNPKTSLDLDNRYTAAVESGDMETAQRMVDEAAKKWGAIAGDDGSPIKMYHGTRAFGFTVFDTSKSDDNISLFTTDNINTAKSYSGNTTRNRISDRSSVDVDSMTGSELLAEAKKRFKQYDDFRLMTEADKRDAIEGEIESLGEVGRALDTFVSDHDGAFDEHKMDQVYNLQTALYKISKAKDDETLSNAWAEWEDALWDLKWLDESITDELLKAIDSRELLICKNRLSDFFYSGNIYIDSYGGKYVFDNQLALELDADMHKGVYELYGKARNQLVIDANGSNWNSITPPEELGLYGTQRTRDIASAAKAAEYDSVLFKNLRDNGGETEYNGLSDVYIFFNADQLKSADPVTYDDNGDVIPLSRRFDSSKPDIRLSQDLESLAELRRENRELRERAAKWRRETQRTKAPELRKEDVRRAAKGLISEMQSTMKAGEIEDDLRELGEYLMRGEGRNERAPSWAEVKEHAGAIAEKLVDSAETLSEGSDPELYEDMKRYVRETKMTIADRDKGDIPNGYEYFRRKNVGILRLGNDGLPVDEAYEQLQGAFGEGYFPADITHPADQLMRIADVINGLKPAFENPYSYRRAEAVEWASNAIIDTLLSEDVRQAAPTFADRQAAKYDAYVARSKAAIRRVREQRDRQIARVKQEHRAQKERARERKTRSEMWRGILALKQDFQRMAEKPEKGNSRHAPMGLAIALRNLTDCFDRERGSREGSVKLPEFKESLVRLRDEYEAMKNDSVLSFYYDPVVMEQLAAVNVELRNVTDPTAMSTKQLAQIYDVLRMCKHSITTANRFIAMEYEKGITDAGRQWGHEVMHATPLLKGVTGQLLNYQLRPDSFFARLSGFAKNSIGEQVQQMFVDGTEKMLRIQQDFYYSLEDFSTDKRFDALTKRGDKALVDVGLKDMDGNTVKLTRDQMLSVYMHLRAEDNLRAAAYGGLDVPNAKAYYTGNVAESFDKSVRTSCIDAAAIDLVREQRELERLAREDDARGEVRPEIAARLEEVQAELQAMEGEMIGTLLDVRAEIEKQMTEFEKELVAAADAWMRKSADYINAETMAMYGIEKANVEHYWTIHRNTNFVNTDMRTAVEEINLENWGSLKERVRSHAPVKLTGFIFELDNHTKKMSQFCGFAAVQRDFNKLYNTRLPGQHTSLSEQVQRKFGSGEKKLGVSGQEYIDNYIKAISGGEHVKPSPIAWVRRNLPRATLSANFRVALSQVASVPTAAAEVGWGAMAKGWVRYSVKGLSAKQQEQLAKTDPWFWQRSRGEGGMREFAEMKESTFAFDRAYNKVAGTKAGKALLNWCQRFDMYATYTQWAMAEEWVKSNRKDLQKGSDAFNEAVSRKYRDIIRKTQPNYTTTERSDLLRDSRESMKWATMYKTQSNQNLNILYEATARLRQFTRDYKNGANGVTAADLKQARAEFANAYTGVILGGTVTFVLFRAAANALMHCMNAYRDDDDELTLESFLNGIWQETLGAMAGMFLLGSEIEEIIVAAVTGGKYWGLSDSAVGALSDVVEDSLKLLKKVRKGDATWEDYRKVIYSFMAPLGVPGENVMKIVNGIRYHIEDIQNGEFLSFEAGVDRTTKQQVNRFFAAIAAGDKQKAQRIYDEMIEAKSGSKDPEGSVQSALRARIKSAYLDEDGETITESQALQLLKQYGGKSDEDAEKAVREWKFEREHGFKYDDLKAAYLSGEISDTAYVKARMEFGGKSKEEAEKDLRQAKVFKEYGVEYGEGSVVEAVLNGEISESDAYTIWRDYGGVSEKEAQSRADQLRFVVEHPETAYDDVKSYTVQSFYEYGEPAGIPAENYMSYMAEIDNYHADVDANGNTISGSKKQKVVNYINTLPISNEQKTAMYLACGYAKSKIPAWT